MPRLFARVAAVAGGTLLAMASVSTAFAHEVRPVGAYVMTVGWQHEPTYVGVENSVQLFVHNSHGSPVTDLAAGDLKVAVTTGGQTSGTMDLIPTFDPDTGLGLPGEYLAALLPTAPGTYAFHITGAIHGQAIDQTFTSSSSTFDDVKDPTPVEFPVKQPTSTELSQLTTKLQTRVATLESSLSTTQSSLDTAQNLANRDQIIAIVAGVIGLAGVIFAAVAWRRRPA
jgi:hypothetical protein